MTRSTRRVFMATTAAVSAALLIAFLANAELARDERLPDDVDGLARWLAAHPADWRAASALSAAALDSDVPSRLELWRGAYEHARRLAPHRGIATTSFIRGGLFHWYELPPADRKAVLHATAPLLRDQPTFTAMSRPLWELTRDFDYLRRNAPDAEKPLTWLRDLAATHGLFDDYRELRDEIERRFAPKRETPPPGPIPGKWTGTCGRNEVCISAAALMPGGTIAIHTQNAQSDEVPPYVEIYVNGVRMAEGPVADARTFRVAAPAEINRVEVRLANPRTRNYIQRRVRLS